MLEDKPLICSGLLKFAHPVPDWATYCNSLIVKNISSKGIGIVLGPEALRIPWLLAGGAFSERSDKAPLPRRGVWGEGNARGA